eukprot:402674-Hanusia_phi.AAC.1
MPGWDPIGCKTIVPGSDSESGNHTVTWIDSLFTTSLGYDHCSAPGQGDVASLGLSARLRASSKLNLEGTAAEFMIGRVLPLICSDNNSGPR